MKVKIRENAYGKLASIAGQWVEVDTTYLFSNQYNLAAPHDMRVMDRDVSAVIDDERDGLMKCGYCGFQTHSAEEMERHYQEEEAKAHSCDGCLNYHSYIADSERKTEKVKSRDGDQETVIETVTTVYTWKKKCYSSQCRHLEHRDFPPTVYSAENCYFLKYPNGYGVWFDSLPLAEKWRELGFGYHKDGFWEILKKSIPGTTYSISIFLYDGKLNSCDVYNSRRSFHLGAADAIRAFNGSCNARYSLRFDDDGDRREDPLEGLPKTAADDVYSFFTNQDRKFYQLIGKED